LPAWSSSSPAEYFLTVRRTRAYAASELPRVGLAGEVDADAAFVASLDQFD